VVARDGKVVAGWGKDGKVRVWNLPAGQMIRSFEPNGEGRLKFALSRIFHVGFFYLRMVDGCSSAIPRVGCTSGIQPLATSDLKLHLLITLALQRFRAMVPRLRLPQPASQHRFSTCVRSGDSFSLRLTSAGQWR